MARVPHVLPALALICACGTGSIDPSPSDGPDPERSTTSVPEPVAGEGPASGADGGVLPVNPDTQPGAPACAASTTAPQWQEPSEVFCPDGARFDVAHRLCADDTQAYGPFPPAMVDACLDCGGIDCESNTWPVEQARGLRGTGACPPGTSALDGSPGLCEADGEVYGPFPESWVAECEALGGGSACGGTRWSRAVVDSVSERVPASAPGNDTPVEVPGGAWSYLLGADHGVRSDSAGQGHFGAPRLNNPGGHSGIDFLAPVGATLHAPCDGEAFSGVAGGYGNYVALLCEVPADADGSGTVYVSLLLAHLDEATAPHGQVSAGSVVGSVGKSGNASGNSVMPHVHFEAAIHADLEDARAEGHQSSNHADNPAAERFRAWFEPNCLVPLGLEGRTGPIHKGRRPDPFLLLECMGASRAPSAAPETLAGFAQPWSDHYEAEGYDVDQGR